MKKTIILGMALLLSFSFALAENCDVNGDGIEDLTDVVYLAELSRMDLNGDFEVNLEDAILLSEAINKGKCNHFWDLIKQPEEEQEEQTETQSSRSSGNSRKKYDLDKRRDYDFTPFRHHGRMFILNEETYNFNYLGINIYGRPIVAITSSNYLTPLRLAWLKEDSGTLWFYKTKYTSWEREYLNYELEIKNDRLRKVTLSKVEDKTST